MAWTRGGDAGPPATPALPYSTRNAAPGIFHLFLQARPLVPPCRPLPGQGGSSGHRGVPVPTTPVHIPGDPLRVPTVLVSPCPHCTSPVQSPRAPHCVPTAAQVCPLHVPIALCLSLHPLALGWGGHKGDPTQSRE